MMSPRPRLLLIDNFDSFTYNLWDYFLRLGVSCEVVRNDRLENIRADSSAYDGIVLSPGPGRPEHAGRMMEVLAECHKTLPILGICLGHQAIGLLFGATLVKAARPVHGKTSDISHTGNSLFSGLPPRLSVMRYHSLLLQDFPEELLEITAWTEEGEIMALSHRSLPLAGVQFHPESIQTPHGLDMLRNWIDQCVQTVPRLW
jgi:anthranilate synthase component 2